jgi:hypothetical protein
MKGVIPSAMKQMIVEQHGEDKWNEVLANAPGVPHNLVIVATASIDDHLIMSIIGSICQTMGWSMKEFSKQIGEYWVLNYAPRVYKAYVNSVKSSREMITRLDSIHLEVTKSNKGLMPPRFKYTWQNQDTLLLEYQSPRGFIDVMLYMTRALGKYFNENVIAKKLSETELLITFPPVN